MASSHPITVVGHPGYSRDNLVAVLRYLLKSDKILTLDGYKEMLEMSENNPSPGVYVINVSRFDPNLIDTVKTIQAKAADMRVLCLMHDLGDVRSARSAGLNALQARNISASELAQYIDRLSHSSSNERFFA